MSGHERVLLYNTDTLKLLGMLPFPERIPHVLKFSRNGKWLLAAGGHGAAAGRVVIWDVATGKRLTEIGDEADVVLAADISARPQVRGPRRAGQAHQDLRHRNRASCKHKIKKHTDWVTAMEFSPDGELLATGDRNGGAFVWEAETGGIVFTLGDHKDAITDMSWRADSQMLATASEDGRVILWYAEDGFPTRTINAQAVTRPGGVKAKVPGFLSVAYSKSGLLATGGRDNTARLWKAADGASLAKLDGLHRRPFAGRLLPRRQTGLCRRFHRQGQRLDRARRQAGGRSHDQSPGSLGGVTGRA